MSFYNVKTRRRVEVPETLLQKQVVIRRHGVPSYAVTAECEGARLYRFVTKLEFDALNVPVRTGS